MYEVEIMWFQQKQIPLIISLVAHGTVVFFKSLKGIVDHNYLYFRNLFIFLYVESFYFWDFTVAFCRRQQP